MPALLKKSLLGVGVLLGLLAAAGVITLVVIDPAQLVAAKREDLLKLVSDKLGRQVTAGEITTSLGTDISARVVDFEVAGAQGRPPQVRVGALDMRFSLLRAILSLGEDLHVETFTVQGLMLRAARDEAGRWDFQDILDKLAAQAPPPSADAPSTPEPAAGQLAGLRVASVRILDGRVEIDDQMLGRPLAMAGIDIRTSDVVPGKALAVTLAARLEDGPRQSPVSVAVQLDALPADLSFDPLPDLRVEARVMDLDVAPWGGLLPGDVPAPLLGTLRLDVKASARDDAKQVAADGVLFTRGLVLRDAVGALADVQARARAPRGLPLDMDAEVSLSADTRKARYAVKKLSVRGNGLDLSASGEARGTSLAALETANLKATVTDVDKLLSVLPASLRPLPPALRIEGPVSAHLAAAGAEVDAGLDLDAARVRWLDLPAGSTAASTAGSAAGSAVDRAAALFDKAAARPLNLKLHGVRKGEVLDVDRFALVVDTARIGGTLSLPTAVGGAVAADVRSGPVELSSLQGLLPPFRDALGRGQRVAGVAEVTMKASAAGGAQLGDVAAELRNLDVNLAATTVRGSGALTIKAAPAGEVIDASVTADFDRLAVQQTGDGGALLLNKPAGLPLRLDVSARKHKERAEIPTLKLAIGRSTVTGKGAVEALDTEAPRLSLDLGDVALAFDDLRATLPGAAKLPAGGRLGGAVKLAGGTTSRTLAVDVRGLDLAFGTSRIAGDVNVKNLTDPVLDVNLRAIDLGFDDVRPLSESASDLPAGGRFKGAMQLSGDTGRPSSVKARVQVESLKSPGTTMRGSIQLENLDKPRFDLDLQADSLDVDQLLGQTDQIPKEPKPKKAPRENPHGLSRSTRELLVDVNGRGTITAQRAVVEGIPVQGFKGSLVMTRGAARFDALEFKLYGGTVKATGTALDLPAERIGYDLRLEGKDIDLGAALADQTRLGRIFSGKVSPDIRVKGRGIAPGDFVMSAEGPAALSFASLGIKTLNLLGPVGDALKGSGKIPGLRLAPSALPAGTDLEAFTALTQFVGGRIKLAREVDTQSAFGRIAWKGSVGLDAGLDLDAVVQLTPAVVSRMTGGQLKVKEPVPVPLRVGGTWDKPRVTGVDVTRLVTAILAEMGGNAVKEKAGEAAQEVLGGLLGKDDKKSKDKAGNKASSKRDGGKDKKSGKSKSTTDAAMDAAKGLLGR